MEGLTEEKQMEKKLFKQPMKMSNQMQVIRGAAPESNARQ